MLSVYPACFFKEDDGYSVVFQDLNYLATCGKTLDESMAAAVECLAGYLYTCEREGEKAPAPSPIDTVSPENVAKELGETCAEAFVNLVVVDVKEYAKSHFERSVKKTLTIPAWLNDAALERNINFSQVLQDALKQQIAHG